MAVDIGFSICEDTSGEPSPLIIEAEIRSYQLIIEFFCHNKKGEGLAIGERGGMTVSSMKKTYVPAVSTAVSGCNCK